MQIIFLNARQLFKWIVAVLVTTYSLGLAQHDGHKEEHHHDHGEGHQHESSSLTSMPEGPLNMLNLGTLEVHTYPVVITAEKTYIGNLVLLINGIKEDSILKVQLINPNQDIAETTVLLHGKPAIEGHHATQEDDGHEHHHHDSEDDHQRFSGIVVPWFTGAEEFHQGTWRVVLKYGNEEASIAFNASSLISEKATQVFTAFLPAPSLTNGGQTEALAFVFREEKPVHSGMKVQRSMPGMQHTTDGDNLTLIHDHFQDLNKATKGTLGAMVNRVKLNFAMAGEWDVLLHILGSNEEVIEFSTMVLDE